MGKPKRIPRKKKGESALGSDDEDLYKDLKNADSTSREFIYNEIDEFNINREKILLESDDEVDMAMHDLQEEVLALSGESSEDDEGDLHKNDYYARMAQKDEIASDIEDNEEDNLPNVKAWGKRKYAYYSTDYVDQDYGGFQGSDAEMAEAEEKEAVTIQKRLLKQLDEEDFALEWLPSVDNDTAKSVSSDGQRVSVDLSKLSDEEKLELLKKESPELLIVVEDFKTRMCELKDKILPLLPLVEDGRIPPGPGADYLRIKRTLIYTYCTNIAFYMTIRSKDVNIRNHPVLKRLLTFRKLLQQLQPIEIQLEPEIQCILEKLKLGEEIKPEVNSTSQTKKFKSNLRVLEKMQKKNVKKNVSFEKVSKQSTKNMKQSSDRLETEDEKEALAMYQMMRSKKKNEESSSDDEEEDKNHSVSDEDEIEENMEDVPLEKRGITYQIAKNKGLMPHRKKEYRNPRVRHRVKFQKAKVRRKGQFKQPRTETQRYGGEVSGIRIGSKRGTKLK